MTELVPIGGLLVAEPLASFVNTEALTGTGITAEHFWSGAEQLLADFTERNRDLVAARDELQHRIDDYHRDRPGPPGADYRSFLTSIGYLAPEPAPFKITTTGVDPEVSTVAGPQLVVPLLNARFAINAANARWGSLYDALYGTDVIDETEGRTRTVSYNPVRGAEVIARGRAFLDRHLPLEAGTHADVTAYRVDSAGLLADLDGRATRLRMPELFVGYRGERVRPTAVVLVHNGLHVEIAIDPESPIGRQDRAGVKDLVLESAVTTIMDLEDSVAAVDAEDKVVGYRNWLRLMQRRLTAPVVKDGRAFERTLAPDRVYRAVDGSPVTLPGRSLLFIRQVGLHMTTDAVLGPDGQPVPEGLLDALICGLGSRADLRGDTAAGSSRSGSIYVVKPKLHGPDEVAFSVEVFARVERILGLPDRTIKIGIMDEERRTSTNLRACIHAARDRVVFINTGFLDRTGDELHTSMRAGPMVRKAEMRSQPWITAYEDNNVDAALACGFLGRAQIGKGMWPAPDNLADMLEQKVAHPRAGASCAWVPSPTAATLHALHYHEVNVAARQRELSGRPKADRSRLLTIPLAPTTDWSQTDIMAEADNNIQGILGYVVRWVNAGVGCSKVPDLNGTPLMEDRATCRISSQHVANWLRHGVVTVADVEASLRRMAAVVDAQNAGDPDYQPMAPAFDGPAFAAARALIVEGEAQPSGYTEPILHAYRRAVKQASSVGA
jgi:malate synthase